MTTVDARGYSCPEPVIMTRKALMSKEAEYAIMVDNKVAVAEADGVYTLTLKK